MTHYDKAYFETINAEEAPQAERLADVLVWKYAPRRVLDIGCATGLYLRPFLERGCNIRGLDYSPEAFESDTLQIPRKYIAQHDITKKPIRHRADLTICIEVLEHIEERHAVNVVQNIAKTSDTIFFTAAQPGQGGHGHVNCQPKEYWEHLFFLNGMHRDRRDEDYLRAIMAAGYHMGWLTNNLMVFKR